MKMIKVEIGAIDDGRLREGYIILKHVIAFRRHIDDCNKTVVFTHNNRFTVQMRFEDFELAMINQE